MAGCATRADLDTLRRDQRETRALLADQSVAIEGLRRRIEILRQETSEPGGGRRKGAPAASPQVNQRLNDVDARLVAIEQVLVSQGHLSTAPAPGTTAEPPGRIEAGEVAAPEALAPPAVAQRGPLDSLLAEEEAALQGQRVDPEYRDALTLVRQGRCTQATPKFRDFIRRQPQSPLADNAQFWIGACFHAQREFNQAIKELSEVMLRYSKGDKAPPALLLLAQAFQDSGDNVDARLVLKKLMNEYPQSKEAAQAKQKLPTLGD